MNRDYFINPHQSKYDARAFGKTGPVLGMEQPSIWARLFRRDYKETGKKLAEKRLAERRAG